MIPFVFASCLSTKKKDKIFEKNADAKNTSKKKNTSIHQILKNKTDDFDDRDLLLCQSFPLLRSSFACLQLLAVYLGRGGVEDLC